MQTGSSILLAIIFMMGFILLTACHAPPGGVAPPPPVILIHKILPTIKVHVVGGPKLKVKEGGNCPPASNSKGCIDVPKAETAEVTFVLRAPPVWYFTEFRICKGTEANKTLDCNLSPSEINDFKFSYGAVDVRPNANGVVNLTGLSVNLLRDFDLSDANQIPNDYFYTLEACKPDPTNLPPPSPPKPPICAESDPPH